MRYPVITQRLRRPIEHEGVTIAEIKIKRPRRRDCRGRKLKHGIYPLEIASVFTVMNMTGLSYLVLSKLYPRDYARLFSWCGAYIFEVQ